MANPTKCAHPQCNCRVPEHGQYGKYCSEHCREAGDQTELMCDWTSLNPDTPLQSRDTIAAPRQAECN